MTRTLASTLTLLIPSLLVLTNIYFFMTPQYLAFEYGKAGFPKAERFSDADRFKFSSLSLAYVRGDATLDAFKAMGVYDAREIKHMVDVRELVAKVNVFYALDAALVLIALVALGKNKETRALAARALFNAGRLTLGLFVGIGLFAAFGFQTFFTLFHRIFFEGDTWLFNYTDSLIQFYPLPFWFDTSILLVALTIGEAIVVGAIGWAWQRAINKEPA